MYAVTGGMGDARISERNPRTLGQRGPAVPLGKWEFVAGLSPDGSLLALTAMNASPRSIRFLDVVRKRWHGAAVPLPTLGTGAVRWADDRTVIVLGERPDGLRAVFVDAERRRVVRTVRIPGHLEAQYAEPTPAGMALLLDPLTWRQLGPVLVGVIRPSGAVKVVEVERIVSGSVRAATPADADRRRDDVARLRLRRPRRARRRGRPAHHGSHVPHATRSQSTGRYARLRPARHLDRTRSYRDRAASTTPSTATLRLGLSIVDTRTWRLRRIDRAADFLAKSGDLLIGLHADGSLAAFGLDGKRRFSVGEQVFQVGVTASNGRYIYAYNVFPSTKGSALIVDAQAGATSSWQQAPLFGSVLSRGLSYRAPRRSPR